MQPGTGLLHPDHLQSHRHPTPNPPQHCVWWIGIGIKFHNGRHCCPPSVQGALLSRAVLILQQMVSGSADCSLLEQMVARPACNTAEPCTGKGQDPEALF